MSSGLCIAELKAIVTDTFQSPFQSPFQQVAVPGLIAL